MATQHKHKGDWGQLFIVATPIGNLGDITYRAVEILRQVDVIAAEDTRISRRLLDHYGIATPMLAYHDYNEREAAAQLCRRLQQGENIALISDAGTPLISDPGYRLIHLLRAKGVKVVPVPGPCSPIAALSASGLPTDRFTFLGFLPRSGRARKEALTLIAGAGESVIVLESPRRLVATLRALVPLCPPPRQLCVAREITKMHEEFVLGEADEVFAHFRQAGARGEVTIIIGPRAHIQTEVSDEDILRFLQDESLRSLPPTARARQVAGQLHVSRERVYALLTASRQATSEHQDR